jgi:hypothetical protein
MGERTPETASGKAVRSARSRKAFPPTIGSSVGNQEKGISHGQSDDVGRRTGRDYSHLLALIRRSGLLTIVAGAYMFVLPFVHPSDAVGHQSVAWVPVHLLYFTAQTVILLVLVGIFAP